MTRGLSLFQKSEKTLVAVESVESGPPSHGLEKEIARIVENMTKDAPFPYVTLDDGALFGSRPNVTVTAGSAESPTKRQRN